MTEEQAEEALRMSRPETPDASEASPLSEPSNAGGTTRTAFASPVSERVFSVGEFFGVLLIGIAIFIGVIVMIIQSQQNSGIDIDQIMVEIAKKRQAEYDGNDLATQFHTQLAENASRRLAGKELRTHTFIQFLFYSLLLLCLIRVIVLKKGGWQAVGINWADQSALSNQRQDGTRVELKRQPLFGLHWGKCVGLYALAFAFAIFVASPINDVFMTWLFRLFGSTYDKGQASDITDIIIAGESDAAVWLAAVLFFTVVGPIAEELLFTGIGLNAFQVDKRKWSAILIISLIFAALHGTSFLVILSLSVVRFLTRVINGSIFCPMALHMLNNTVVLIIAYMTTQHLGT